MRLRQNLASALNTIKIAQGLTLTEFADELEISRSHLQVYLKGDGNPTVNTIEHLAKRLNVSPIDLIAPTTPEENGTPSVDDQ